MNMLFYAKLYLLTVPVFFAIDMLWLGLIAKDFYQTNLGYILSPNVNWIAAVAFYLIFIAGILYFAVVPALGEASLGRVLLNGALFGFFTYMTYELTNMATLPDWPLKVVIVDTLWGAVLSASVAIASYLIGRWLDGA
ncbi:putative membrane protein [Thioflavicoccus mobilis 8321]|uniref:Putative membrane protein n=1 Tax=Thioflavicoccus mobilis 8321 TaxID=765912 RepID=L0GUT8_9GAMM|nr:DUF2177 family protein [Thioflavicoccus mobilis]AGA89766.1 putative membrane protein [Thioflavicoccus mobilis 8321]